MNEREQIINYLLNVVDQKNKMIVELQVQIAELSKKSEPAKTVDIPSGVQAAKL
jgi:hypothetical protein